MTDSRKKSELDFKDLPDGCYKVYSRKSSGEIDFNIYKEITLISGEINKESNG